MHKNKTKEPLFHIAKRAALPWYLSWAIRIGAIVLALVACAALTVFLTHENPFQVYATMFRGAFSTPRRIWNLLQSLAMLLCVSLALTPAFKMRFWNIGGEGQVLIGGLATAACMICLGGKIPNALLILTMIVASMLAGAIWALIPAFFKAQYNTNETLFTLMMNYVAIQLVAYFVIRWEVPKGSGKIGIINQTTRAGWLPVLGEHDYLLNILIVLALTVFMSIYLKYSKHGYEISVVGESVNTARYIGINVKKVILRTMALSGAVCGDHCSPISDTTIMASAGAHCSHVNHVSTQLPYAMTAAAISAGCYLLCGAAQAVLGDAANTLTSFVLLACAIAIELVVLSIVRARMGHTGKEEVTKS